MLVIDAVWLTTMAPRLYRAYIGHLLADTPKFGPAALFYALYALGITLFVVLPGIQEKQSLVKICMHGGLFGLIAYATYDLTNHATLKNWPATITIIDLIWGTLLTATVSLIAVSIIKLWQ